MVIACLQIRLPMNEYQQIGMADIRYIYRPNAKKTLRNRCTEQQPILRLHLSTLTQEQLFVECWHVQNILPS
jgi:hypothetical protein